MHLRCCWRMGTRTHPIRNVSRSAWARNEDAGVWLECSLRHPVSPRFDKEARFVSRGIRSSARPFAVATGLRLTTILRPRVLAGTQREILRIPLGCYKRQQPQRHALGLADLCAERDSNPRRINPPDLQSGALDRSAIDAELHFIRFYQT